MIKPVIGNELEEKIELLGKEKPVESTWWTVDTLVPENYYEELLTIKHTYFVYFIPKRK
jgi:hypothetical protein